jgi:predicted lipoprotein with Yx(FWY)xxD motif
MTMRKLVSFAAAAGMLAAFTASATAADKAAAAGGSMLGSEAPLATPAGITLKSVRVGQGVNVPGQSSNQPRLRLVFADSKAMTLYTYDKDVPGKSNCTGECATSWPPALAEAGAKPTGEWSLVTRDDGAKQWAFRGRPLYTYIKDAPPPEGSMAFFMGGGGSAGHGVDKVWNIFEIQPTDWLTLPTGIGVREVITAPGQVMTDYRGRSLYTVDLKAGGKPLGKEWIPFEAPQLAIPVGDFTVVARNDGIYQWALKGKPLYTYTGDADLGDSNGKDVDKRVDLAWVMHYNMPAGLKIAPNQRRGGVLALENGQVVYSRDRAYANMEGGHNARGGGRGNPTTGRAIGLTGCDAECEKTWLPVIAPADAKSQGYWWVFDRPDGKKQWGYQGYALYTYSKEQPGQITGYDIFDMTVNDDTKDLKAKNLGLYWRPTSP